MSMKLLLHLKHTMISLPLKIHHNKTKETATMNESQKSIDLKLEQKNCTKAYHIICLLCRSPTKLNFPFYDFSIIFYD